MIVYEEWKPITDDIVPGIQPWYYISNLGYVKSSYSNKELKLHQYEKSGYWFIGLKMRDGTTKILLIHRLVMMAFDPIPNHMDYEVNHKDGNKSNNMYTNLEWSTRLDNIRHAWENNLYKKGEEHHNAIYTENQIHQICKGLENHLPYKQIAEKCGIEFSNNVSILMSSIKRGDIWKDISSQYHFTDERSFQLFSNDEIHTICGFLELGKTTDEILDIFGIEDSDERFKKRNSINSIRRRDKFKNISKDYNF